MARRISGERKTAYYVGMVKDVLDEADLNLGGRSEKVVMIKCRACGKLNEEDSRFCQECGKEI